jgi:hypothetical protein
VLQELPALLGASLELLGAVLEASLQIRASYVSDGKQPYWQGAGRVLLSVTPVPPGQSPKSHPVNSARRYNADALTFLKGVVHARP